MPKMRQLGRKGEWERQKGKQAGYCKYSYGLVCWRNSPKMKNSVMFSGIYLWCRK